MKNVDDINTRTGISLMEEIFLEAFSEKEIFTLEIMVPKTNLESELEAAKKRKTIFDRVKDCLENTTIPGIKSTVVKKSKDAEIVLEVDYFATPTLNRNRGNRYRDAIGEALKKCLKKTMDIRVEGTAGVNNTVKTAVKSKSGNDKRFIDIQIQNKQNKMPIAYIEVKRGDSGYHDIQRRKDGWIAKNKKVPTYVVRGKPVRRGREI